MMLKTLIIFISFGLLISCTKKVPNQIQVDSPFQFIHDASLQGTEFVAKLNEDQITNSQLLSPSPALMELEQRINDIILRKVYSMAQDDGQIVFAFEEPKDGIKKFFGKEFKEKISVTFDPKMTGGIAKLNDTVIKADALTKDDDGLSP